MDGFSAVSLAGNLAQFVEYGISIARKTREIATNARGIPEEVAEIELILNNFHATLALIKDPSRLGVDDIGSDATLQKLVEGCGPVASNLVHVIERLQLQPKGETRSRQAYGALKKAALFLHKRGEIDQLPTRLLSLRTEISTHMIVLIEQQQHQVRNTLLTFSSETNEFQTRFQDDLELSLKYMERISKRLDSVVVRPRSIGKQAYAELLFEEKEEQRAWSSYMKEVTKLHREELDALMEEKKKSILQGLSFGQLHDRESVIPEAHQRTFEWIFVPDTDRKFMEWLRREDGAFWISGKAGAGKSTLMKFLADHAATEKGLVKWADGDLVIAKHFFWRPGTPLERSQEGLFRSLLPQILMRRSELIPSVCSERWLGLRWESSLPWSRTELVKAMRDLKSKLETAGVPPQGGFKLCLFIDGLDEFDGDTADLIRILCDLTESSQVKMCASSRPWLEFSDAFGNTPWMIQVHDLTRQDMLLYVRDNLEADEKFAKLRSKDAELASNLVANIVDRAEGVFPWLYLVIRSLLRGLRNEDDFRDLNRRIEALPQDLETYFSRMLNDIEDVYRQRTARLFLTFSITRMSLPVLAFFFLNFDDDSVRIEPQVINALQRWPDVDPTLLEALETKKRQLVAQCKDIIHVTADRNAPLLFGEKVGFLHRTVYDFINTEEIYHRLEKLAGPGYEPKMPLFRANVSQVEAMIHLHARTFIKPHLTHWILSTLFHAYEVEVAAGCSVPRWINDGLDTLDRAISEQFSRWDFQHAMKTLLNRDDLISFINLAAVCDLASYVKYRCPDVTPSKLDLLAPGWRCPSRVEQLGSFEITPQTSDIYWRLGNTFRPPVAKEPREAPGHGLPEPPRMARTADYDANRPGGHELPVGNGLPGYALPVGSMDGDAAKTRGHGVHRGFRKLASLFRRS